MPDITYIEDMLILLANLVEGEWHSYFTAYKWPEKKDYYLKLLNAVRLIRIKLMKDLGIDNLPDENHCLLKHMCTIFVRSQEIGTRYLKDGNIKKADEYFKNAFQIFKEIAKIGNFFSEPEKVEEEKVNYPLTPRKMEKIIIDKETMEKINLLKKAIKNGRIL